MKKIKTFIIHALGGITKDDARNVAMAIDLRRIILTRKYLDLLYGKGSEEWCEEAYSYVCRIEREMREEYPDSEIIVETIGV